MASTNISIAMENLLPKRFSCSILILTLLFSTFLAAQSCVCYQKDQLIDFKDTDFIGLVTVISKEQHPQNADVDIITFTTQELFKGNAIEKVFLFQKKGFGKDNSNCRLYLKTGDQLILYANKKPGYYFTMPCYRNRIISNDEPKNKENLRNQIEILRQLVPFKENLETTSTRCDKVVLDDISLNEMVSLSAEKPASRMGLYAVRFDQNLKVKYVEALVSFNHDMDNKVKMEILSKNWGVCDVKENEELLIGYFYVPETRQRTAHLSPL